MRIEIFVHLCLQLSISRFLICLVKDVLVCIDYTKIIIFLLYSFPFFIFRHRKHWFKCIRFGDCARSYWTEYDGQWKLALGLQDKRHSHSAGIDRIIDYWQDILPRYVNHGSQLVLEFTLIFLYHIEVTGWTEVEPFTYSPL